MGSDDLSQIVITGDDLDKLNDRSKGQYQYASGSVIGHTGTKDEFSEKISRRGYSGVVNASSKYLGTFKGRETFEMSGKPIELV